MKKLKVNTRRPNYNIYREYKKMDFFNEWLHSFAPQLTKEQYQKYIKNQYIWHIFSWELISKDKYLCGDEARNAYNAVNKKNAQCFQLWFDEVPVPLTEEFDTAEKIESADGTYVEFYVVSKDFKWTYIVTHETGCGLGPYFMKND